MKKGSLIAVVVLLVCAVNGYAQTKAPVKKPVKKTKVESKTNTVKKEEVKPLDKIVVKDTVVSKPKTDPPIKVTINVINDSLIQYGDKTWMTRNLASSFYSNGDTIPEARSLAEWKRYNKEKRGCWCYINFNKASTYTSKFGKLYNFYAVVDSRGLAPKGFHIPKEEEWLDLADKLGGTGIAGKRMKSTKDWYEGGNGDNSSGFNVVPVGILEAKPSQEEWGGRDYEFKDVNSGFNSFFWTHLEKDKSVEDGYPTYVKCFNIFHAKSWVRMLEINYKETGLSVRCLKN